MSYLNRIRHVAPVGPGCERGTADGPVEPIDDRLPLLDGSRPAGEDQQDGPEGVFGIKRCRDVPQETLSGAGNAW
jgi:hypothetical protein